MKIDDQIQECKKQITALEAKLTKLEHQKKKRKGVLKTGDFLLVEFPDDQTVIFYGAIDEALCLNSCFDNCCSMFIQDIIEMCEKYNYEEQPVKFRKISKEEAITYLP